MSCSAQISYQFDSGKVGGDDIVVHALPAPVPRPAERQVQTRQHALTSFVLVDPSKSNSNGVGKDIKRSIRKHASKACAAQRLATIAERKRTQNVVSKRERQRQQAAQRLEAALEQHSRKFSTLQEAYCNTAKLERSDDAYNDNGYVSHSKNIWDTNPHGTANYTEAPFDNDGKKKCSIPWLLADSPASTNATIPTPPVSPGDAEPDQGARPTSPNPFKASLDVYFPQLSPLAFQSMTRKVDPRMSFLLDFMFNDMFPLMDTRLPNKADKVSRSRYAWRNDLPRLVLSSEPLFYTILLCAATLEGLWIRKLPGAVSWMMKYRHLAICSVNRRLQAPEQSLVLDSGLISAIATLGVWERQRGSKEIWLAHRRGVETLTKKLRERNEHDLVQQMVASCHLPDVKPWTDNHSEGFKRLRSEILLDDLVVSAICRLPHIQSLELGQSRLEALENEAREILQYTTSSAVSGRVEGSAGNRISLEMNVLLQAAGVSMIKFLGQDLVETDVNHIDFPEMCQEALGLGKNVSTHCAYDELLLWAMFTIYALNNVTDSERVDIVVKLLRRLRIATWQCAEDLLQTFAYMDSATMAYHTFWSVLAPYLYQQEGT